MPAHLIIAGVPKAGTTSLFRALASHPDISGASEKETQFFRPMLEGKPLPPLTDYEIYFRHWNGEPYRLEATPEYFYGGERLIAEMKSLLGDVRVILVFREPLSRLVSFFRFKKAHMHLPKDLGIDDYVAACQRVPDDERLARRWSAYMGIHGSFYDEYLPAWADALGEALKLLFLDDLAADPDATLHDLAAWLDIDPQGFSDRLGRENRTMQYRSASMQRVALWTARRAEGLSRRHPGVYRRLTETYYLLNGRSSSESLSPSVSQSLEQVFAPHRRLLAGQLVEYGCSMLPDWLEGDQIDRQPDEERDGISRRTAEG